MSEEWSKFIIILDRDDEEFRRAMEEEGKYFIVF